MVRLVFAFIFLAIAVVLFAIRKVKYTDTSGRDPSTGRMIRQERAVNLIPWGGGVLGLSLLFFFLATIRIVAPGEVGVPVLLGDVKPTLKSGIHFVNPFYGVNRLNVKTQEFTMSGGGEQESDADTYPAIQAKAADGQNLRIDITVQYHLDPTLAGKIYEEVGSEYFNVLVLPAVRETVRDVAANYNAVEAFTTEREAIARESVPRLERELEDRGVIIEDVKIRDVDPGKRIRQAIELKLEKEQELQRKEFEKQTAMENAEIRRIEANGLAEAQRIINSTLSENYLMFEFIQKMEQLISSDNAKVVMLPFSQSLLPMFDALNPQN